MRLLVVSPQKFKLAIVMHKSLFAVDAFAPSTSAEVRK